MARFLRRLVREPLVHFLLAGLALFVAWRALTRNTTPQEPDRVVLTDEDVRRLRESWTTLWQRPPDAKELAELIENELREEILYREAVAMGLDQDDSIIRRRLVQKMEFLAEDTPLLREPRPDELKAWFEQNRDRFEQPPRATFRQVYFSFFKRQEQARDDAEIAFDDLAGQGSDAPGLGDLGDRVMFQPRYEDQTENDVSLAFGSKFADALFELRPGAWQGPIESGYGWHVVWIDALKPPGAPPFEQIQPQVKYEWLADQRAAGRRRAYEALRAKYEIVLPPESGP